MTDTNNAQTESVTVTTPTLSDPEISFADYQTLRRGGEVPAKAAPVAKTEQKDAKDSETLETEAKDDEGNESEQSDESLEPGKDKTKKVGGVQKKINKLTARVAERDLTVAAKDKEIDFWKAEALKTSQTTKKDIPAQSQAAKPASDEPNPDNFETHQEYVKAVAKWTLDLDKKAAKEEQDKQNFKNEQDKAIKAYLDRKDAFAKTVDDFDDSLESVSDIPLSVAIQSAILESEYGPQVAYELSKNRAEIERISKLGPLAAAREIGKIEARVASSATEEKPEPKKITTASKPINPVGGTKGASGKSIFDPGISFADYEKQRREQMKRRR